jgi:hypothetical protein
LVSRHRGKAFGAKLRPGLLRIFCEEDSGKDQRNGGISSLKKWDKMVISYLIVALVSGNIPRKYGQKYGTVPPLISPNLVPRFNIWLVVYLPL